MIDAHVHFWNYDKIRDAWITDEMKILQQDFLPKDIKPVLKENNVDGDIYYCIDNGQEGAYIFLTGEQYRFIKENYADLLKEGG